MFVFSATAYAATTCLTVDEFNAYMEDHAPLDTVTLTFDVTGVNPNDFAGTKGALADLTHLGCAAGGSLALKVYGPENPPNDVHPSGTLKHEYGYNCGPNPYTETWAEPNASAVVFVDGSERCDVTIWIDPLEFGYRLDCDSGLFEGVGDNTPAMPVDHVTLFALTNPDTWHIDNAVSTYDEVCFTSDEPPTTTTGGEPPAEERTEVFQAIEDATVAADAPDSVYPDPSDLCVEAGYCEAYVKFDLSSITGTIVSASLELDAQDDPSANGSGAEVWSADASWSEDTITWNTRPGGDGAAVGRVGPIASAATYAVDVGALVPGVHAFALIPGAGDTDGAHFVSTEGAGEGPRLVVTWLDDGGTPPGTTSGTDLEPGTTLPPDARGDAETVGGSSGCGCAGGPTSGGVLAAFVALVSRRRSAPR